jgi:hypothetical protein
LQKSVTSTLRKNIGFKFADYTYHNIVDFNVDGDEYFSDPHLFCKFDIDGMPYEEIYYKSLCNPKKEIPNWDLDKSKRIDFNQNEV